MTDMEVVTLIKDIQKGEQEKARLVQSLFVPKCVKCGKRLTDSMSKIRGYGPVCWNRLVINSQEKLF